MEPGTDAVAVLHLDVSAAANSSLGLGYIHGESLVMSSDHESITGDHHANEFEAGKSDVQLSSEEDPATIPADGALLAEAAPPNSRLPVPTKFSAICCDVMVRSYYGFSDDDLTGIIHYVMPMRIAME